MTRLAKAACAPTFCDVAQPVIKPMAGFNTLGLLDLFPGAAVAYSLRYLSTAYTGPVIRVVRDDNTQEDFKPSQIIDGALLSFCAGGDGFILTRYDQSGNGLNETQAGKAKRPQIVKNGVLESVNGKPVIKNQTANVDIGTVCPLNIRNSTVEYFSVFSVSTSQPNGILISSPSTANAWAIGIAQGGAATAQGDRFTLSEIRKNGSAITLTNQGVAYTQLHTSSLNQIGIAGVTANDQWDSAGIKLHRYHNGLSFSPICYYSEDVIYLTSQSANRAAIDANQKGFWGTP